MVDFSNSQFQSSSSEKTVLQKLKDTSRDTDMQTRISDAPKPKEPTIGVLDSETKQSRELSVFEEDVKVKFSSRDRSREKTTLEKLKESPTSTEMQTRVDQPLSPERQIIQSDVNKVFFRTTDRGEVQTLAIKDEKPKTMVDKDQFGADVLRAATPAEQKALQRSKNPFFQFFSGAKESFLGGTESLRGAQQDPTQSKARTLGAVAGGIGFFGTLGAGAGLAPKGVQAARGVLQTERAAQVIQTAKRLRDTNLATRLGVDIGVTAAKGAAIVKGAKVVSAKTAPEEQQQILQSPQFQSLIGTAFQREREAIGQSKDGNILKTGLQTVAFELSPFFSKEKDVFEQEIRQGAIGLGLDPDVAVSAAKRQRTAVSIGEGLGLLEISRSAEAIGRREVSRAFESRIGQQFAQSKAFSTLFKTTFVPIGAAGVVEGSAGELTQQLSRNQDIDLKKIGVFGALGGVSAGALGGTIAGLRPKRPTGSKILEGVASIADPFEKPGDILQDITEVAVRRATGRKPNVPVLTVAPSESFAFSTTRTQAEAKRVAPKPSSVVPNSAFTPINIPIDPLGVFTPTSQKPVTIPFVPQLPKATKSPQTETQVPINIPSIPTSINIPVVSPQLRVPPPIPLQLPSSLNGVGTRVKLRKKFVDELDLGLSILGIGGKSGKR